MLAAPPPIGIHILVGTSPFAQSVALPLFNVISAPSLIVFPANVLPALHKLANPYNSFAVLSVNVVLLASYQLVSVTAGRAIELRALKSFLYSFVVKLLSSGVLSSISAHLPVAFVFLS